MAARVHTVEGYKALLDKYDTWLFDCDGVLWEGTRIIPGIIEVLSYLRTHSTCPDHRFVCTAEHSGPL